MDISQSAAVSGILKHDISFVWGPPGTGKSFTLSGLIAMLYQQKEKTLVCCLSNIAVDQLLNKVIDVLNKNNINPQNCDILRAGHSTDNRILSTNYLFPNDAHTDNIRRKIRKINRELDGIKSAQGRRNPSETELIKIQDRIELVEELKDKTDNLVHRSTVLFSTIANYVLSTSLSGKIFDNLIVDEASMLSLPFLMALSRNIFKRIILVGDPNQLGPISLFPDKILSDSVFDYCKILDKKDYPGLYKLIMQRRSNKKIVGLTNQIFYDGILKCENERSPEWVYSHPYEGKVIKVVNSIEDDCVKPYGTSRRNFGTYKEVLKILENLERQFFHNYSIGIITPFKAQVKLYRRSISSKTENFKFWSNIKVGTVHTFQGSECDIIIFDLVESRKYTGALRKVSKLFNGKDGERLINVALSRAKNKLIVVGDTLRFKSNDGLSTVSSKVIKAITYIRDIYADDIID